MAGARARCSTSGLFRRAAFSAGISSGLLSYLVMFGALYAVAFYLESGPQHLGPGITGLELSVMPVAFGVVAPFAGRAADRLGACLLDGGRDAGRGGQPGRARSGLSQRAPACSLPWPRWASGLGLFTPPNNAAIMGAAPRRQAGVASGVLNMTRGMGTSMGQAVAALILGLVAAGLAHPSAVVSGFAACALFLAVVSVVAAALAALRGEELLEARLPGEA